MAVGIAARIKRRFLVIVDKEFLMNQWRTEMKALMPNLRVGIVQGPKQETDPALYDCTICMIQTICGERTLPSFSEYGFAIFDECHHLGAQHFSRCLQKIQLPHMLGLSATPTREDDLTKVFFWFLGKPVYWEKTREPDPSVEVKSIHIDTDDVDYNTIPTNWRGEVVMAQLLTNILGCAERTAVIVDWIRRLAEEPARRILVLSERIGHLEAIEKCLEGSGLTIAYYIGGMKEQVREAGASTARVLLASYAMASEAMNIKSLNSVILASPRKHVEQSTGRILRTRATERVVQPVIIDIVDKHQMYKGQHRKRLAYYRQCAYKLENWGMDGPKSGHAPIDTSVCLLD
jgi:superfamily II DNA or RNA helicase